MGIQIDAIAAPDQHESQSMPKILQTAEKTCRNTKTTAATLRFGAFLEKEMIKNSSVLCALLLGLQYDETTRRNEMV